MSRDGGDLEEVLDLVAHDLRNPLSAIMTAAEVLRRREELSEGSLKVIDRVQSSADRMANMIQQLSDWTRLELGVGLELDREPGDLHELVRELVEDLPPEQAARVHVELDGDGEGRWDRERIEQLLATLVSNALDHGDTEAPVRVTLGGDAKQIQIEVHNRGAAMAPDVLGALYDPLARRRVARPTRARGLGFGLLLARAIATGHDGTLTARSSAEGTTFTLQLPR